VEILPCRAMILQLKTQFESASKQYCPRMATIQELFNSGTIRCPRSPSVHAKACFQHLTLNTLEDPTTRQNFIG